MDADKIICGWGGGLSVCELTSPPPEVIVWGMGQGEGKEPCRGEERVGLGLGQALHSWGGGRHGTEL